MNNRNTIQEELSGLNSNLPHDIKEPVFSVPNAYFENFSLSVLTKIKGKTTVSELDDLNELSPVLAGISKNMPFSLPPDYFSTFENEIPVLISKEELPSVLASHERKPAYEVPVGYFEELPALILSRVSQRGAKIISIKRTAWMRIAAAAVIAGIIAITSIFYFNNNQVVDPSSQPQAWLKNTLKELPDKDLEEFINTTDAGADNEIVKTSISSNEVRGLLDDVSDNELDVFLTQVQGDEDLSVIN